MVDVQRLRARFEAWQGGAARVFSAPGRVNLIGEHTDYNDGFVLPMAIERRTYVACAPRPDRRVVVRSLSSENTLEFELDQPGARRRGLWLDYVEGTAQALLARGFPLVGASLLIDSDVPVGAGLSSSAALELAVAQALVTLGGSPAPDRIALALAGQAAEHEYVGTQCGIMDQFIAALGRAEQALLIDCRSLTPTPVPLRLGTACILVCDTAVKHELSSSAYNERRRECREGVAWLARERLGLASLRDIEERDFESLAERMPEPIKRRCRHVVTENARTLAAARCLASGQLTELGALMSASHESLRTDYEVSCPELDVAVAAAAREPGVYGARMTGGGFGGCTVTLLEQSAVPRVCEAIGRAWPAPFRSEPKFFATGAAEGVREES